MQEDLTKAVHSMEFAVGSLRDAMCDAGGGGTIHLLMMIHDAEKLKQRIEAMHAAVLAEEAKRLPPVEPEKKRRRYRRRPSA
jgi:hypothetical protein